MSYKPKLSIGLPVYNGQNSITNAITSILSQTFHDFELIISDNASIDLTPKICENFASKDTRIRYIGQQQNMGASWNFRFVLQEAMGEYFMWAAVDDLWEPTFIEKNIQVLESHPNIVGSISEVDFFGKHKNRFNSPTHITKNLHVHPVSGNYLEKAKFYLKFRRSTMIYGIFRTGSLQKSFPESFPYDLLLVLNILKYGDFHVLDEVLMHRSSEGISSVGMIHSLRSQNVSRLGILFMYLPFMKWSVKNFGLKFMFKNIPAFIGLFYVGYGRIALDILRTIKYHFIKT